MIYSNKVELFLKFGIAHEYCWDTIEENGNLFYCLGTSCVNCIIRSGCNNSSAQFTIVEYKQLEQEYPEYFL